MLRRCRSPSAVSFESYLLVACGANDLGQQLDTVQIFDGYQWAETLGPLMTSYFIKSAVLNGVWYLTGAEREEQIIYFASLDSLINCCLTVDYGIEESPWQLLPAVPYDFYSLVALGNRLVAIGGDEGAETPSSAIHAYAPNTESWMHVANLPLGLYSTCAIVLPSGELMVVGGHDMCPRQVHMGSLVESDHAGI